MKLTEYITKKDLKLVDFKIFYLVDKGINTITELRKHINHYQLTISIEGLKKLDLIRMNNKTIVLNEENPIIKKLMGEI